MNPWKVMMHTPYIRQIMQLDLIHRTQMIIGILQVSVDIRQWYIPQPSAKPHEYEAQDSGHIDVGLHFAQAMILVVNGR